MIELAIFDMDGLLLDTERVYERVFVLTAAQMGYKGTKEMYARTLGLGNARAKEVFKEIFGADFPSDKFLENSHANILKDIEKNGLLPKTGAAEILDLLDRKKIKKAVASSNDKDFVTFALKRGGMAGRFDAVNTAQDVKCTKPAPDLFLKSAADFKIPPEKCIVFEDSENGVLAAEAAGMRVVLIPDIKMPSGDIKAKAYKVYDSLRDAPELF
ncbi:MAG: HAD family phosphatase [Elusimicrobium sp.]|jgi:HAD superfamily hydrolase (TIGR01509 family)|nr:HAD family phosphatase [Elusimicrobium sp.]